MKDKEEDLINLFEKNKDKINWKYLDKFDVSKIPRSFINHFNLKLQQKSV